MAKRRVEHRRIYRYCVPVMGPLRERLRVHLESTSKKVRLTYFRRVHASVSARFLPYQKTLPFLARSLARVVCANAPSRWAAAPSC